MVSGYAQKFKMALCSSSSEVEEYSDPLEVAPSAGLRPGSDAVLHSSPGINIGV